MSEFNENNKPDEAIEQPATDSTMEYSQTSESTYDTADTSLTAGPDIVSGAETAAKSPIKIIAIIAAVILVLAASFTSAYAFIPAFKNSVKKLMNSPEDYYAWVEQENADDVIDELTECLDENKDKEGGTFKLSCDLNSDTILGLIGSDEIDGVKIKLPDNISFTSKSAMLDKIATVNDTFSVNGEDLLTANCYIKDGKVYYQIPEISTAYACLDPTRFLDLIAEKADDETAEQLIDYMKGMLSDNLNPGEKEKDRLISNKELNELLKRYSEAIFSNIKNVKLENDAEINADGVKCEYTKLTAVIDEGTLLNIGKAVLNELKNDKIITNILTENFGLDKDEYSQGLDKVIEALNKYDLKGGKELFRMNVYVSADGRIAGRTIENAEDLDEEFEVGYYVAKDGDKYGFTFFGDIDGETFSLDGNATEDDDKYSGEASVSASGKNKVVTVKFNDFEALDEEFVKGSFTADLSIFGLDDLTMNFDEKDGKQLFNTEITYGGKSICTISTETDKELPDKLTAFNDALPVYDSDNSEGYANSISDESLRSLIEMVYKILGITDTEELDKELDAIFTNPGFTMNAKNGIAKGLTGVITDSAVDLPDDDYDIADDDIETDYFDDYEDMTTYEETDLSKIKFLIDGKDFAIGQKPGDLLKYVTEFDEDTVPANGYIFGNSKDNSISLSMSNETDKECKPADCVVSYLSIYDPCCADFSINGVKPGEDVQKLADSLGIKLKNKTDGSIQLTGSSDKYESVSINYYDGKIFSVSIMN